MDCKVGTSQLNFISGGAVDAGNGEAMAMIVDPLVTNPGDPTIETMVWDNAGVPTIHNSGGFDIDLDIAETLDRTFFDPVTGFGIHGTVLVNEGMLIGMAMATGDSTTMIAGPSDGWTEIVQDFQTGYMSTGGTSNFTPAGRLPPSHGSLVIYDNATDPTNRVMLWHMNLSAPQWFTSCALLRYPVGGAVSGRRRTTVQFVG